MIEKFPEIGHSAGRAWSKRSHRAGLRGHRIIGDGILDSCPPAPVGGHPVGWCRPSTNPASATRCAPPWRWRRRPTGSPSPSRYQGARPHRCRSLRLHRHARRPTTCVNCAANSSSTSPPRRAAYQVGGNRRTHDRPPAHLRTRSSRRSRRGAVAPHGRKPAHWTPVDRDYTNESASICKRSSTISPSKRR